MSGPGEAEPRARILIVDDEPMNVDLLEQELELLGHDTLPAGDGAEALDVLARQPVDLVLLDVMMPRLDGYEVLRRIKADGGLRHLPVIMISALDQLSSVVRCIELGAEDYLPKPFEPVLLAARVGACLEKKRLHDREAAHLRRIEAQLRIIVEERERADRLLHAILPAPAVAELKASGAVLPRRHDAVVVLFADLVAFTRYCEANPPEAVVAGLDRLAHDCEALLGAHGLEKIKMLGDGFLATANLLAPLTDPVPAALRCALAMQAAAGGLGWSLRVGIHVGPVVAGVVGQTKFSFDLWGDTVNVAARLASLGTEAAVYLSDAAWQQVAGRCRSTPLGPLELKGGRHIAVHRCEAV
jgi:adenylate cyclase